MKTGVHASAGLRRAARSTLAVAGLLVAACGPRSLPDEEAEIGAIRKAIESSIAWAGTKDVARLYGVIADDSSYLEVHPDERVVKGIVEFRKQEAFWLDPDFKAIRYAIRDLRITRSRSGGVAWFYGVLDDINEWKGQPASWIDTRWTGVLEKRNGRWVIVQMHFSNSVPG